MSKLLMVQATETEWNQFLIYDWKLDFSGDVGVFEFQISNIKAWSVFYWAMHDQTTLYVKCKNVFPAHMMGLKIKSVRQHWKDNFVEICANCFPIVV